MLHFQSICEGVAFQSVVPCQQNVLHCLFTLLFDDGHAQKTEVVWMAQSMLFPDTYLFDTLVQCKS